MPHHEIKRRPRTAWLLLMIAAAGLAACSGKGQYRVGMPPILFSPVLGSILSKVRNDLPDIPDPHRPGLTTVQVDRSDPAQSIKSVLEAKGEVWIFPARDSTEELRVHLIRYPQNIDDATYFDVRVEVKAPYTVSIGGQPFEVTQESASKLLYAAFAQTVQRVNGESYEQFNANVRSEGDPVVAALRQLVPWANAKVSTVNQLR